jgi:hypothetical protein
MRGLQVKRSEKPKQQTGMLVVCVTNAQNRCGAVFEVANRNQATVIRKLLYRLLPHDCHCSVATWVETKQHYVERTLDISVRIGLTLAPVKWFARGNKLPERFEDLQIPAEVLQSYLEQHEKELSEKPFSYWGLLDTPA